MSTGWSRELAHLNSLHDVFLGIVDAAFAFELPGVSAGWIEAFDVESGRSRVMSRRELRRWPARPAVAGRGRADGKRTRIWTSCGWPDPTSSTSRCWNGSRSGGCAVKVTA